MGYVNLFAASYEEIRSEFKLKRRRSAQTLVASAIRKFRDHFTIFTLMKNYKKDFSELTEKDIEGIATAFAILKQQEMIEEYLERNCAL